MAARVCTVCDPIRSSGRNAATLAVAGAAAAPGEECGTAAADAEALAAVAVAAVGGEAAV